MGRNNTNEQKGIFQCFLDWNGTLIDDLETNFSVINTLLSKRNKNTILLSQYRQAFTFPIKEFYRRVGFPIEGEEYQQLVCDYGELYKSNSKGIPLMAGALDVLRSLNQKQIRQYILSASDRRMVLDQISAYGIRHFLKI